MSYFHKAVFGGLVRLHELCLINFTRLREADRTVVGPCITAEETEAGLVVNVSEAEHRPGQYPLLMLLEEASCPLTLPGICLEIL